MCSESALPETPLLLEKPSNEEAVSEELPFIDSLKYDNPLLHALAPVERRVRQYHQGAQDFYFKVMLSDHSCSQCGGNLEMADSTLCICNKCGRQLDPTLAFQQSTCCGASLIRRALHYVCAQCKDIVPSRFLFNEKLFDKEYFRQMMRASRERARRKKEEVRRLLAGSRSDPLTLTEEPDLESVPGLLEALDDFLGSSELDLGSFQDFHPLFDMESYRQHILNHLGWDAKPFSRFPSMRDSFRLDRIHRFITLVYMDHSGEVSLHQQGQETLVQRVHHEAD